MNASILTGTNKNVMPEHKTKMESYLYFILLYVCLDIDAIDWLINILE